MNLEGDNIRVRELEPESTSPRPHPYPNAELRHYRMMADDSPTNRVVGSPDVRRSKQMRTQPYEDTLSQSTQKNTKSLLSVQERSQAYAAVECPHCGRRFNEKAAQRHIPICA